MSLCNVSSGQSIRLLSKLENRLCNLEGAKPRSAESRPFPLSRLWMCLPTGVYDTHYSRAMESAVRSTVCESSVLVTVHSAGCRASYYTEKQREEQIGKGLPPGQVVEWQRRDGSLRCHPPVFTKPLSSSSGPADQRAFSQFNEYLQITKSPTDTAAHKRGRWG